MAVCPFADWQPIDVESSARSIRPSGVVMHTAVSDSDALEPSSEIEWHFYVGEQGELTQFRDTEIEAHCQLDGNYFDGKGHISIETWDGAGRVWDGEDVDDIPSWTDAQVRTIGRLLAWLHDEHGIPVHRIESWDGRGIGYHRQFTSDSYPRWNSSHACPGDRRVAQVPDLIEAGRGNQEDDLPSPKDVWEFKTDNIRLTDDLEREKQDEKTMAWFIRDIEASVDLVRRQVGQLSTKVDEVAEQVSNNTSQRAGTEKKSDSGDASARSDLTDMQRTQDEHGQRLEAIEAGIRALAAGINEDTANAVDKALAGSEGD